MKPMGPLQALAARFPVTQPWEDFATRYVPRPQPVGDDIADSLLVDPSSTHVIVGSIGSGKSTELFRAATRLRDDGSDLFVVCEDADLLGDGLLHPEPGIVVRRVAQAFAAMSASVPLALAGQQAAARVQQRAQREVDAVFDALAPTETTDLDDLRLIVAALAPRRAVVLLDSFDRVLPASDYIAAIERDLPALRRVGVGLVLTAPNDLLFLHWREALSHFSARHVLGALAPAVPEHHSFLHSVIARRDPDGLIVPAAREALLGASGGHLRHLVELAHAAARLALRSGAVVVSAADVGRALDDLGSFLASAMTGEQVTILDAITRGQMPARATDALVGLVRDARVFDDGDGRYRLHPALQARPARRVA